MLKGGRGSLKSSFISVEIILGIMNDPEANAVVFRKVKETLRKSVFEQLLWAIEVLGVKNFWHSSLSPLELTYTPTGQKIVLKGCDNSVKVKASKFSKGYAKFLWFEETDEFEHMEEIRRVLQTFLRGGDTFTVFYSYNPPASVNNWVNKEAMYNRPDRIVHSSTYLEAPPKWLGKPFIQEAESLKKQNERSYNHEFLGEITGTGGEVFLNVKLEHFSNEMIDNFDNIHRGIDFGFAIDPFCYLECHFDRKRRDLYIYRELYEVGLTNANAIRQIKEINPKNETIFADQAEPKSIHEFRQHGLKVIGAKKGRDSVEYGIKFLQDLNNIFIDDRRCPNTAREFLNYELERSISTGEFISKFSPYDNHSIDCVRYCLVQEILKWKERKFDKNYERKILHAREHQDDIKRISSNHVPKEFFQW